MAQDRFPFLADTIRVLCLDDQEDFVALCRGWLGLYRFYHFDGALTVGDAWRLVSTNPAYHVLLYDLTVPGSAGPGVALIRRCAPETACLVATAMDDSDLMFHATNAGAVALVKKGRMTEGKLLPVVNQWFLTALLGILPGAYAKPAFQRVGEALLACRAASVSHLAKLAGVQRSRLKQICSVHYRLQARVVLDVVRAYCGVFAQQGLCPSGVEGYVLDDLESARLEETFVQYRDAIGRFLRRARPLRTGESTFS